MEWYHGLLALPVTRPATYATRRTIAARTPTLAAAADAPPPSTATTLALAGPTATVA